MPVPWRRKGTVAVDTMFTGVTNDIEVGFVVVIEVVFMAFVDMIEVVGIVIVVLLVIAIASREDCSSQLYRVCQGSTGSLQ